ncbi:maleylpyruvate isomerase family mycothiol-dependent enzyme [Streptosporangium sp. NPDC049078]|uniref:maleylpyruvate isomerase family mycothiol-dependent enzyme n=1 Tax=Streptosporangium sp. NPDC049078 TaxID=3155767 RepID=UPI003442F362
MTAESKDPLADLNPFDIFDTEARRLDRFFSGLDAEGWLRPSRLPGWSVRDVLGHLAGEELYNHACLDDDVDGFAAMLGSEGVEGGFDAFNAWCVERRRDVPVEEVLQEWRRENGETRERMRELGRDALLPTLAGPYPVGSQTFHYDSEYATHADDVGAPVAEGEEDERVWWRVRVGAFALAEQGAKVEVELTADGIWVHAYDASAQLAPAAFVAATVGRLPDGHPVDHPLDRRLRAALRCLA